MIKLNTLALQRLVTFSFIVAIAMIINSCGGGASGSITEVTPPNTPATRYAQLVGKYNPGNEQKYGDETIVHDGSSARVLRTQWATPDGTIYQGFKIKIKVKNGEGSTIVSSVTSAPILKINLETGVENWGWEPLDRWDDMVGNPLLSHDVVLGRLEDGQHIEGERDGNGELTSFVIAFDPRIHQFGLEYPLMLGVGAKPKAMGGVAAEMSGLGFNDGSTSTTSWSESNGGGAEATFLGIGIGVWVGTLIASAPVCPFERILGTVEFIDAGGNVITPPDTDIDLTAPDKAKPGSKFNVSIVSDCPGGWVLKNAGGTVLGAGKGNKTVEVTMTAAVLVLTVTDTCGNSDTESVDPEVDQPTLLPPTADITASSSTGDVPKTITFDASASHDNDEGNTSIVDYKWDLDGDGSYEATSGSDPTISYPYIVAASYTVSVKVTDDEGETDTDSVTITLTNPPATVTYTFFVAGTKGQLSEGETWAVDETGSQLVDVFQLKGSDGSTITISRNNVVPSSDELPFWVFENFVATGEIQTVKWSQPDDPDVEDPGNIFINPGTYGMHFVATQDGKTYTINWKLQINDRADFP